ncbi:MAG TPA: 4a-hydroxytetrahydrobiopterin dehydratase [Actinomycetota bacterium]|nr:4a-hydroxytetrahydrobiopterin dehydratase [Actinomycetota bacterium]
MAGTAGGAVGDVLGDGEIRRHLAELPDWRHFANALHKEFRFRGFRASIAFVDRIAEQATATGVHPDIEIHDSRVIVSIATPGAGGVTVNDIDLARAIERVKEPD